MPKQKAPRKPAEPDDLVRQEAGSYLSGDGRFEVRQSDAAWYVVDREQTNEFGQELMHGPFPSMKAARAAMSGAREIKPLLRSVKRPRQAAPKQAPPTPPPTWIDKLPDEEAAVVRKTIRSLERDGIPDAEALVRKDRQSNTPAIATALLQRDLERALTELTETDEAVAHQVLTRLGEVIAGGEQNRDPLPGWSLVELGPDREPTGRRLRIGG